MMHATFIALLATAVSPYISHAYPCISNNIGTGSIDSIIKETVQRKDNLILEAVALATTKSTILIEDISSLFRSDLGRINDGAIDIKVIERAQVYTTDIWAIVDRTNAAIDVLINHAKRQIEGHAKTKEITEKVASHLKEIHRIDWKWEQDASEVIFNGNLDGQDLLDKLIKDTLHAHHSHGNVGAVLAAGEQTLVDLINKSIKSILDDKTSTENRLRALRVQILAVTK